MPDPIDFRDESELSAFCYDLRINRYTAVGAVAFYTAVLNLTRATHPLAPSELRDISLKIGVGSLVAAAAMVWVHFNARRPEYLASLERRLADSKTIYRLNEQVMIKLATGHLHKGERGWAYVSSAGDGRLHGLIRDDKVVRAVPVDLVLPTRPIAVSDRFPRQVVYGDFLHGDDEKTTGLMYNHPRQARREARRLVA